jgi:ComF family protein
MTDAPPALWLRLAHRTVRALAAFVLPPVCPVCGAPGDGLCRRCDQDLVRRGEPPCPRCGEPVLAAGAPCIADHGDLRRLAFHAAPWRYAGAGGALVRRFKLDGDAAAGRFLARGMADALRVQAPADWREAILVPVPLHPARLRQRGFDQTAWLARRLAQRLGMPCVVGALARRRATLPQGDPRVGSRDANVDGAFAVRRVRAIRRRRVVLVDDVLTSGATARECARALLAAGARAVALLTACRS